MTFNVSFFFAPSQPFYSNMVIFLVFSSFFVTCLRNIFFHVLKMKRNKSSDMSSIQKLGIFSGTWAAKRLTGVYNRH